MYNTCSTAITVGFLETVLEVQDGESAEICVGILQPDEVADNVAGIDLTIEAVPGPGM